MLGQMIDISKYLDFDLWDLIWYWDEAKKDMTEDPKRLAHWLGVSHHIGSDMCYWIIPESGTLIAWTTVQHVLQSELQGDEL